MNSDSIFVCKGVQILAGIKIKAKKGSLEVTPAKELVLYGDNGEIIDRTPIPQATFKFSALTGDSVTINGKKLALSFVPPMKTGFFSGGLVAGMEYSQREDVQAGRARREEFKELVEQIQTESGLGA